MNIQLFRCYAELPASCQAWLRDAEKDSLFFGETWFSVFEPQVISVDGDALFFVVYDTNKALALFPMRYCSAQHPARLSSMSNYYSSLYSPLFDPALHSEPARLTALCRIFLDSAMQYAGGQYCLDFQPMDAGSVAYQALLAAAQQAAYWKQSYFCFGNWYLPQTYASYDDYQKILPSRLRNTLQRKSKQLRSRNDGAQRLSIRVYSQPDDVQQAILDFEQIYQRSWKRFESHPVFVRQLASAFAECNQCRLGMLYLDDQPAAAQLWFVTHGTASIYKLAYDERFKRESVGSILSAHMFQYVIDQDRVKCIDYLTGDEPYKQDWMSHRRERHGLIVFNPRRLRGFLAGTRHILPQKLKLYMSGGAST